MSKSQPIGDVVEEMFQSVLATPKRQRRLRSKTFWDNFGFKMRTKDRVEQVREALKRRGLIVNLDDMGSEDKDEWIILTFVEPPPPVAILQDKQPTAAVPTPEGAWFDLMEHRVFESEREVEYYFIAPLLEKLGFVEDDFAIGYPVQMYEGVRKVNKEADFVLFNGLSRTRDDALVIVEAKRTEKILTEDAVGQARAYAMWLTTPYYLVTNGEDLRVYLFRGAIQADVLLMSFNRRDLRQQWKVLYNTLNKESVIDYKEKLRKVLDGAVA
jgi:hypothetical protein